MQTDTLRLPDEKRYIRSKQKRALRGLFPTNNLHSHFIVINLYSPGCFHRTPYVIWPSKQPQEVGKAGRFVVYIYEK